MGCTSKKTVDIIDMLSYDAGYANGCVDGTEAGYEVGYYDCKREFRQLTKRKKEQFLRFIKQKMFGVLMLLATAILVQLCEGDATIAFATIPTSFVLIFARKKLI